jgi:hypothetical protein
MGRTIRTRSYTLDRRPAVIELAGGDALDLSQEVETYLECHLGANLHVAVEDACLLLPSPHKVRREGRTLREEEYESYAEACLAAASSIAVRQIRYWVEEMYVFDWHAFNKQTWASLEAAYESLPAWLAAKDLPRWFGVDELKGPCLWASVEPPGLQVGGMLAPAMFDDWHQRFLEKTIELPVREIT